MLSCGVCLSVCVSVTFMSCVKRNKDIFKIFSPSGSHTILVFRYQTGWWYSDWTPITGASNAGGVGKKRDSGRISGFVTYRSTVLSTVRVANCEKQSCDGRRRAHRGVRHPLFTQDNDEVFVTGSTLYVGEEVKPPPPDTTPLVITPVFCCHRTS